MEIEKTIQNYYKNCAETIFNNTKNTIPNSDFKTLMTLRVQSSEGYSVENVIPFMFPLVTALAKEQLYIHIAENIYQDNVFNHMQTLVNRAQYTSLIPTFVFLSYTHSGRLPGVNVLADILRVTTPHTDIYNDYIDVSQAVRALYGIPTKTYCAAYINAHNRNVYIITPFELTAGYTTYQGILMTTLIYAFLAPCIATVLMNPKYTALASPYRTILEHRTSMNLPAHEIIPDVLNSLTKELSIFFNNSTFQEHLFDTLLSNFTTNFSETALQKIREYEANYNDLYTRIKNAAETLKLERFKLFTQQDPKDKLKELYRALNKHKNIDIESTSTSGSTIYFKLLIKSELNFDPIHIEQNLVKQYQRTHRILTGIFEDKIKIYFKSYITLQVNTSDGVEISRTVNYDLTRDYWEKKKEFATYPNTHINRANCFGSFKHEILNAYKHDNFHMVAALLVQSMGNINIADGAMFPSFRTDVIDREASTIFHVDTQSYMTITEYLALPKETEKVIEEIIPITTPTPEMNFGTTAQIAPNPTLEELRTLATQLQTTLRNTQPFVFDADRTEPEENPFE